MTFGYIYCLSNDAMRSDIFKVGMTKRTPEDRAKELFTTGVALPFKVVYQILVANYKEVEKKIHYILAKDLERLDPNREFFRGPLEDIKKIIERVASESTAILSNARPKWNGGDDWTTRPDYYCAINNESPKEIAHKLGIDIKLFIHANTISGPDGPGIKGLKLNSKMHKNTKMVIPIYQTPRRSLRRSSRRST